MGPRLAVAEVRGPFSGALGGALLEQLAGRFGRGGRVLVVWFVGGGCGGNCERWVTTLSKYFTQQFASPRHHHRRQAQKLPLDRVKIVLFQCSRPLCRAAPSTLPVSPSTRAMPLADPVLGAKLPSLPRPGCYPTFVLAALPIFSPAAEYNEWRAFLSEPRVFRCCDRPAINDWRSLCLGFLCLGPALAGLVASPTPSNDTREA